MKTILFVDKTHDFLLDTLSTNGFSCLDCTLMDLDALKNNLAIANGIIIRSRFTVDKDFIDNAPNLEFIARAGAGMESIDCDYAIEKGIHLISSPEGNRDALGEHTVGMILALMNKLLIADSEIRNGKWDRKSNLGHEINGKTIALIGYGNMGSAFAKRLSGFDVNVIAYDLYKKNFTDKYVKEVDMDTVFKTADIISFHTPLTDLTNGLVNKEYLSKFKKNIYFINTARGKIVDTKALADGIKTEKILGACLDVFEYETTSFEKLDISKMPDAFQYLLQSDKIIFSPHVAGQTHQSFKKHSIYLAEKILKFYNDEIK